MRCKKFLSVRWPVREGRAKLCGPFCSATGTKYTMRLRADCRRRNTDAAVTVTVCVKRHRVHEHTYSNAWRSNEGDSGRVFVTLYTSAAGLMVILRLRIAHRWCIMDAATTEKKWRSCSRSSRDDAVLGVRMLWQFPLISRLGLRDADCVQRCAHLPCRRLQNDVPRRCESCQVLCAISSNSGAASVNDAATSDPACGLRPSPSYPSCPVIRMQCSITATQQTCVPLDHQWQCVV